MEYMITNYREPSTDGPAPGTPEFQEMMGAWMAYNQMLIDGGHWVSGASLAPADTATTIVLTDGTRTGTTDGPFAETKEQLGGYYLIKADDLDQAIELASKMPVGTASLEIRPVAFRPDA
ncbi:MAG: YciI family protein [Actinomycetota bacterium]